MSHLPDTIWSITKEDRGSYCRISCSSLPHDGEQGCDKYHHDRIVKAKDAEIARLDEANKIMREALSKIANCGQNCPVKYIQTVDALALDAIDAANREPQ